MRQLRLLRRYMRCTPLHIKPMAHIVKSHPSKLPSCVKPVTLSKACFIALRGQCGNHHNHLKEWPGIMYNLTLSSYIHTIRHAD